jgi:Flp pilus assembly pilin Flp
MSVLLRRLIREESGQDLIEYGLLVGIITAGAVTAISAIGPKVQGYFETLKTNIGA